MELSWNDDQPIYRQVMSEIISWILTGELEDGDPLPSIRKLATHFKVNPLTAAKACQEPGHEKIVNSQRGVGLFVFSGASRMLQVRERRNFLKQEVPALAKRMQLMNISLEVLYAALAKQGC